MKKIFFSFFVIGFFILAGSVSAQMGMMGDYGSYENTLSTLSGDTQIKGALQEIYQTQNIDAQAQIDCGQVTDDQFEKLGDAYMGVMLPDQQQHETMDAMMGGEGSESLRTAHINMGRSYLGCWSNYNSGPVYMPMMGGNNTSYFMMGAWGNYGIGNTIFTIILWALAIIGLITVVRWTTKSTHTKK